MKVVINRCYGGFGISKKACEFMAARGNIQAIEELASEHYYGDFCSDDRTNVDLVAAVEFLGSEVASWGPAELGVVEIPDDVEWEIVEHGGKEHVAETHKTWR
jgi:hypothetical protein